MKNFVLIWLVVMLSVNAYSQSTITHGGKKSKENERRMA